jgi:hypothetical protein
VTETLDEALAITGADQVKVRHRPRLLSDNGPAYRRWCMNRRGVRKCCRAVYLHE